MPGTPGNPIVTQEWQIALVLIAGFAVAYLLHRIARRMAAKERSSRRDDRGED
ncbi:hypothetical protein [Pinisolibacter sp.]|uniref:hypothetical protein n=1 Tax=Pinisolibacter sp. TaxID=2172024 RepID=UPI002FDD4BFD